ncbi:MAG TPA: lysophospholipid acyltransferase family protein [Microlunatus sp.]|nr:lysophospholipid acyltransferase family protein [Microlunatus sp.]
MADAEIIQLGSRGRAGRGSGTTPSAAARGLAGRRSPRSRARAAGAQPERAETADDSGSVAPPDVVEEQSGSARPAAVEDRIDDDFGTPDIDDATQAAAADRRSGVAGSPSDDPIGTADAAAADDTAADDTATDGVGTGGAGQVPPSVNLAAIASELAAILTSALGQLRNLPTEQLRELGRDPLKAVLQVAETLGVDWQQSLEEVVEFTRSRMSGRYAIDEFGFDPEFTTKVFLPIMRPLAQNWFRVEVRGIENVPTTGSALLVSNHAGTLPIDGMVLQSVVYDEIGRHVRMLGADLIFKTPYSHDFARRTGTTLACQEDAERLLASDQLVAVFPEGFKGLGKPYADRYKLQRFGRGGFVSAAVRAQVPLIPVSIVGSEEIFPLIATAPTLARALGAPYFPITPLFPWFGVLGLIPLPSKWIIQFGEAITTDELPPGAAEDPMVVFNVTDQVRETIQHSLYALLMQRRSAFL